MQTNRPETRGWRPGCALFRQQGCRSILPMLCRLAPIISRQYAADLPISPECKPTICRRSAGTVPVPKCIVEVTSVGGTAWVM